MASVKIIADGGHPVRVTSLTDGLEVSEESIQISDEKTYNITNLYQILSISETEEDLEV